MHVANSMKFSKKMMKSHQLRHAVLGKINFCTFFIFKKNKKWKNIFCRRKTWKNIFLHFFYFKKENKKWKNIFCRRKTWKNIFVHFFLAKNGKHMFCRRKKWKHIFCACLFISDKIKTGFFCHQSCYKVVCMVLAGGHSETLGDYLLLQ